MIVITAATGNIGCQVLDYLKDGADPIRVIVRDPARLPASVRDQVDIILGSHGDAQTVQRAFEGANTVFWLPPGDIRADNATVAYEEFSRAGSEAVRVCGVKHVVGVSALGRGWPKNAGHVTATLKVDDMFANTGVHYRALACASLMENLLRQIDSIADNGVFYWPSSGDHAVPAVATRDVAKVAADLLVDPQWRGVEAIPMMGPENISFNEMASIMSEVFSRPIRFQEITMQDMHEMVIGRGASMGMAQAMVDMLTAKNEGIDQLIERPVPNPAMTDFRTWCTDVLLPAVWERR